MRFLRNTDVKKHLGRAVRRVASAPTQDSHMPNGDAGAVPAIQRPETNSAPVTADVPEKVETV